MGVNRLCPQLRAGEGGAPGRQGQQRREQGSQSMLFHYAFQGGVGAGEGVRERGHL